MLSLSKQCFLFSDNVYVTENSKICYNIEEAIQKMFKLSLDFNIGDSVFLTQIISCRQKNADAKVALSI